MYCGRVLVCVYGWGGMMDVVNGEYMFVWVRLLMECSVYW